MIGILGARRTAGGKLRHLGIELQRNILPQGFQGLAVGKQLLAARQKFLVA